MADPAAGFRWATGIEDTFIAQTGPGRRRLDEYELQQHYRFWHEDIALAAETGFDSIRYGIPWYAVEPERGRFDWEWTDRVMVHLLDTGLDPIIDLVHYGTPLWLDEQFLSPDYPEAVASYARVFALRYPLISCYTPLNEPFINAELCGFEGRWPPYLRGDSGFCSVMNQIAKGIVLTVQALKEVRPDAVMVHVEATGHVIVDESLEGRAQLDVDRHLIALDLIQGRAGDDDAISSYLRAHGLTDADFEWYRGSAIGIDVLGLNYYPMLSLKRRFLDSSGATREEYIWGGGEYLAQIVRAHHERYGCPIFITETSANEKCALEYGFVTAEDDAPPDYPRRRWLDESVATVGRLIAEGIPIAGYTWWPLYDLINWDYREGEGPVEDYIEPMGLFSLCMDDAHELRRDLLPVASYMRRLIEKGEPSGAGSTAARR